MGNLTFTGNATSVRQITTITVGGTWAGADTPTLHVSDKDLVVTLGSDVTTANVAQALRDAIMASSRLTGNGTTDATSNAGGQEFGEYRDFTATVSGSVVTLTGVDPGWPFTITGDDNSTSGTLSFATPQAATGANHWNNVDNWDTGAVPANDDVVMWRNCAVPILHGLPQGSLEVTINHYMSHTGDVGLPIINPGHGVPYLEYRDRYVELDDSGTGTNIAHRFGIGNGAGASLINLQHTAVKCSPVVHNTGRPNPQRIGQRALNICCTVNTSTLHIVNGSVDFGAQNGQTPAWVSVNQTGGDTAGLGGIHTTGATVEVSGGVMLLGQTGAINEVKAYGGTVRFENQTGAVQLVVQGGNVIYASTGTISSLLGYSGVFDLREGVGDVPVTAAFIYPGLKYIDPYARTQAPADFRVYYNPGPDLNFGASIGYAIEMILG